MLTIKAMITGHWDTGGIREESAQLIPFPGEEWSADRGQDSSRVADADLGL